MGAVRRAALLAGVLGLASVTVVDNTMFLGRYCE